MLDGVKALDPRRDARFALHSGSDDPPRWVGDAKIAGLAIELPCEGMHLFRCDIKEVVVVGLNEARDKLVIESWHEDRGVSCLER